MDLKAARMRIEGFLENLLSLGIAPVSQVDLCLGERIDFLVTCAAAAVRTGAATPPEVSVLVPVKPLLQKFSAATGPSLFAARRLRAKRNRNIRARQHAAPPAR